VSGTTCGVDSAACAHKAIANANNETPFLQQLLENKDWFVIEGFMVKFCKRLLMA